MLKTILQGEHTTMNQLNNSIDDISKTIEAEVEKVVPPENHSKYIYGNYMNKQLEDYNLLFAKTREEDPTIPHWARGLAKYIPFGDTKENFVILTEKDSFEKGDRAVFKVRPSWFNPTSGHNIRKQFTILEEVVEEFSR